MTGGAVCKFPPHRITSGGDCFLHVVAIILLSDPLSVSGSNKDRGLLWSGCTRMAERRWRAYLPTVHLEISASLCQQTTYRTCNSEGNLSLHGLFVELTTNKAFPASKKPSLQVTSAASVQRLYICLPVNAESIMDEIF